MNYIVSKLWGPRCDRLGAIPRLDVENAVTYSERRQNDAMPDMVMRPRPVVFRAAAWVTAQRELPAVKGRL